MFGDTSIGFDTVPVETFCITMVQLVTQTYVRRVARCRKVFWSVSALVDKLYIVAMNREKLHAPKIAHIG